MELTSVMEPSIVEDPDKHFSKEARLTSERSRATANPDFLRTMEKLDSFPRRTRSFVMKRLTEEIYEDVSAYLKNRSSSVPILARRYRVSEPDINAALDIIELIRQL